MMESYWDLTEQERAALTSEQVEAFIDVILMEEGVVRPKPPTLLDETIEAVPTGVYYEVLHAGDYRDESTNFVFTTKEQANAFIELQPYRKENNYSFGSDNFYAKSVSGWKVVAVDLMSEQAFNDAKEMLARTNKNRDVNHKAKTEYDKANKVVDNTLADLWKDYRACQAKQFKHQLVLDTLNEYKKLCGDDSEMAHTFLAKAYGSDEIQEMLEWFGFGNAALPEPQTEAATVE